MPRTILVIPPVNHTANVKASDAFLSTVTAPLADCGYYVYPVAVVDRFFKDNGVPTPGDMHSVSLRKIQEIIGPDAVMYIKIRDWTTTYLVVDSTTVVTLDYKLVDVDTGLVLWQYSGSARHSSSAGSSDPLAMVIAAGVHSVANAVSDGSYEVSVARKANIASFTQPYHGLLKGPRHPDFEKDQVRIREAIARQSSSANSMP
ncbi:MAG: DUF799 family lipoprotein [Phycisphaerales bacterium]|nr:DUF799 family lipoprotein [Phycisphaerales bacterium]